MWVPRNISCGGLHISLPRILSDEKVDKFVKSLDIGHVSEIPNYTTTGSMKTLIIL